MADRNGYIGRAPGDSSVVVARQTFEPTGVTTTFTFAAGYTVGYLDVYINGVRLIEGRDYTATSGSTVDLDSAATSGDVLELVAYKAFNVTTIDTAPGNLSVGNNLTVDGYISAGGTVTGSAFYGDGSNLTGISYVPTAGIATYATTAGIATYATTAGIATAAQGLTGTPNITVGIITASSGEFSGNVSIAGTLTYEDVTNVDSIGLVTARSGVRINAGGLVVTSGVSTLSTLIPDETRFVSVSEKLTRIDGNTVNLVYNSSGSNIGLATNPSGNITLSVTGIPETSDFDSHTLTFSVFVNQTGTARSCTAVTLNGYSATIHWAGGSLENAISGVTTTSGMDIYSFTGINTVGSAATTANYYVLGVVNGGYR